MSAETNRHDFKPLLNGVKQTDSIGTYTSQKCSHCNTILHKYEIVGKNVPYLKYIRPTDGKLVSGFVACTKRRYHETVNSRVSNEHGKPQFCQMKNSLR